MLHYSEEEIAGSGVDGMYCKKIGASSAAFWGLPSRPLLLHVDHPLHAGMKAADVVVSAGVIEAKPRCLPLRMMSVRNADSVLCATGTWCGESPVLVHPIARLCGCCWLRVSCALGVIRQRMSDDCTCQSRIRIGPIERIGVVPAERWPG